MTELLSKLLNRIANLIYKISKKLSSSSSIVPLPSVQSIRVIPWFKDNGDKTHRLNYDLGENSLVFDLGGYEGQWASDIFGKYACFVHVFEPFAEYAQNIERRFEKNFKVKVYHFGLASRNSSETLYISADSSSVFSKGEKKAVIHLVRVVDFIKEHRVDKIDLMKINIEGGEYDLLEHLLETGFVNKINNIQVQFHDFVPNAENRMKAIQNDLNKTHYLTYQYEFVWENWKRK